MLGIHSLLLFPRFKCHGSIVRHCQTPFDVDRAQTLWTDLLTCDVASPSFFSLLHVFNVAWIRGYR